MKYFLKKLLGHEKLGLLSPGLRNFFEIFVKPSAPPPPYILNVRSLILDETKFQVLT